MKKTQNNRVRRKSTGVLINVVVGPILGVLAILICYVSLWGLSKAFYILHEFITGTVIPWIHGAWTYVVAVWVFVIVTTWLFSRLTRKKEKSKVNDVNTTPSSHEEWTGKFHSYKKNSFSPWNIGEFFYIKCIKSSK